MKDQCLQTLAAVPTFTAAAGFDGYVDTLSRVVRESGGAGFFRTIAEFGTYITTKAGRSGSIELRRQAVKMGGNMPIFARALSALGGRVACVGALGDPDVPEVFAPLMQNCDLYPACAPGTCNALEFEDGKLMLAENGALDAFDFEQLRSRVGLDTLAALYGGADLIALLNWSELRHSIDLWESLLREVLQGLPGLSQKTVLMDLSDCSARSPQDVARLQEIIRGYSALCPVYVSLNRNEAEQLLIKTGGVPGVLHEMAGQLFALWGCRAVVVHLEEGCGYIDSSGYRYMPGHRIGSPVLLTGGGDHFNAGFAYALLSGLPVADCLRVAGAVSGYYVARGESPDRDRLAIWMLEQGYFEDKEERET